MAHVNTLVFIRQSKDILSDLICQLFDSVQPVFNVTDSCLDIRCLLSQAISHLLEALQCCVTHVFYLEIQHGHIGLAFHLWKLETVPKNVSLV